MISMDHLTVVPSNLLLSHTPFFRVSCGCIGFWWGERGDWGAAYNVPLWTIVKACDHTYDEDKWTLSQGNRTFDKDKDYTPLTLEEVKKLVNYLQGLIIDGYCWRRFCCAASRTVEVMKDPEIPWTKEPDIYKEAP